MSYPLPREPADRRTACVVAALVLVGIALCARLIELQWWRREGLAERANRQRSYLDTIPARPGEIVDRHGRLLATSITTRSLYVAPSRVSHPWQTAWSLAEALDLDADRLYERLAEHRDRHFLWVRRRLTDAEADRVRALGLPEKSWGFREEHLRRYPQGRLAAHVLGLRDIDGKGQGGLEQAFDAALRGVNGRRVLVRDARGRVIDVLDEVEQAPRHGRTLVTTLDAVIQLYVERELDGLMAEKKPAGATAIVMDPATGEVLAMASRPTFDPNDPGGSASLAWNNLAVTAMFEPGSTFKPFVVAWALDRNAIQREERFDCERGEYRMGKRVLHDHHPYGVLDLPGVLVKSSNIGMAKIGEKLGNPQLYKATVAWGFGSRTGIELPGELPGLVRPLKEWTSYSTGSIPMGQELAVTPIQLLAAHSALANGGTLISPRLVLRHTDGTEPPDGSTREPATPSITSRVCAEETAAWLVREPMVRVVREGTGRKGRLADYTVFGKTGTAQKLDPATGQYSKSKYLASFVCGAPADDPRVIVLVMVDEPAEGNSIFGGDTAAPAASRILRQTLLHLRIPSAAH